MEQVVGVKAKLISFFLSVADTEKHADSSMKGRGVMGWA